VRPGCVRLEADGFTATAHEGPDEGAVAGPYIEHRASRQNPVQTIGKR